MANLALKTSIIKNNIKLGLFSIGLPILGSIASITLLKDWRFEHIVGHALLEIIGAIIALGIILLISLRKTPLHQSKHEIIWIMTALISMGLLDLIHALMPPGNNFVWLHSVATFVGGAFFACLWFEGAYAKKLTNLPLFILILSLVFSSVSIFASDYIPLMVYQADFTFTARFLNIMGGIGFIAGFAYLYRKYRHTKIKDYYLLSAHCMLFGMAGILFELSAIWDAAWWWWHILRFAAYLILVHFFFQNKQKANFTIRSKVIASLLVIGLSSSLIVGIYTFHYMKVQHPIAQSFQQKEELERLKQYFVAFLCLICATNILIGLKLGNTIAQPISTLARVMEKVRKGQKNRRAHIPGNNEIAELAQIFNGMLDELNELVHSHEENEAKIKAVINTISDGIITIDSKGIIQTYNPACETIFGYKKEEVKGKNINILMPEPYHSQHDGYIKKYNRTKVKKVLDQHREVQGKRKDGTVFPLDLSVSQVKFRDITLFSGIVRDITAIKQNERQLNNTLKQLQISNEELERFAYIASHDLKSPLKGIQAVTDWLIEDLGDDISEESKNYFSMLKKRTYRMEKLLNDILEYSRLNRKEQPSESVTAKDLLCEIKELINLPPEMAIIIDPQLEKTIVHRMPIRQVFDNLINNAIKHHDKAQGEIKISVNDLDGFHQFAIVDDGPGIDASFRDKIFEMFQTLESRDKVEGSGMGLAFVRKIVNHAGGQIKVESNQERGATFLFTWPKIN